VLWLVGISGHGLLRAVQSLRHAAGSDVHDRRAAPAWYRRHSRLGTVTLPDRRARALVLRWNASLRARRSAQGISSRLGLADLQLRPHRGAELSSEQCAVLARRLSRRWTARRRRSLDALPRLLTQAGR